MAEISQLLKDILAWAESDEESCSFCPGGPPFPEDLFLRLQAAVAASTSPPEGSPGPRDAIDRSPEP